MMGHPERVTISLSMCGGAALLNSPAVAGDYVAADGSAPLIVLETNLGEFDVDVAVDMPAFSDLTLDPD